MKSLKRDQTIPVLTAAPAALTVEPDEIFLLECAGPMDKRYEAEKRGVPPYAPAGNVVTGPVHVSGAAAGGAVAVEIMSLAPAGMGLVGRPGGLHEMPTDGVMVRFNEKLEFPYDPMLGCLGTAPAEGELDLSLCGDCGGNMDVADVGPGATVFFPVFHEGGLLGAGDGHARQGDGEIGGQGVEIALDAVLRCRPVRKRLVDRPYLVRGGRLMVIGWGLTTDEAIVMANDDMVKVLVDHAGLAEWEAHKLIGIGGEMRLGQVVCPTKTVRAVVPMSVFGGRLPLFDE